MTWEIANRLMFKKDVNQERNEVKLISVMKIPHSILHKLFFTFSNNANLILGKWETCRFLSIEIKQIIP